MPQQALAYQVTEYQRHNKLKNKNYPEYDLSKMKRSALF